MIEMHRFKKKHINAKDLSDTGDDVEEDEEDIFEVEKFLDAKWEVILALKICTSPRNRRPNLYTIR